MRLIRTRAESIEFVEIEEEKIHRREVGYAILSHRWGEQEISFQDAMNPERQAAIEKTEGYRKIRRFCAKAAPEYKYAWIDTCCINKESSAELSEAINSMYRWYQMAGVCYAYLNDVAFRVHRSHLHAEIERSQWFTRGWTLQELIAPPHVLFLSSDWREIGSKKSLRSLICKITLIDEPILQGQAQLHEMSVAKRMSWASTRVTTRLEDTAYCLMGIFDVNMPLLYGEGEKAFVRLQEEIMKSVQDETIFAWERDDVSSECPSGLLARSPADYASTGTMIPYNHSDKNLPVEISNRGIGFSQHFTYSHPPGIPWVSDESSLMKTLILNCLDSTESANSSLIGIQIQKRAGQITFVRIGPLLHRHVSWTQLHFAEYDNIFATRRLAVSTNRDITTGLNVSGLQKEPIRGDTDEGRNIIVLLDWLESDEQLESRSNLRRIYDWVQDNVDSQVSYYGRLSGIAFHDGILYDYDLEGYVREAYVWLIQNYHDTDKIFLFGYSSGAIVAQALAQLLENRGILNLWSLSDEMSRPHWMDPNNIAFTGFSQVWKEYRTVHNLIVGGGSKQRVDHARSYMDTLHQLFRKSTGRVAFLGLFDAVAGDMGRENEWKSPVNLPSEITHPANIVRHAIAIDERRPGLQPIIVGDAMVRGTQDIEQMWFEGGHSSVGGVAVPMVCSRACDEDRNYPLAWMAQEAAKAGVIFNQNTPQEILESHREKVPRGFTSPTSELIGTETSVKLPEMVHQALRSASQSPRARRPNEGPTVTSLTFSSLETLKNITDFLPSWAYDVQLGRSRFIIPKWYWRRIPRNHKIHRSVIDQMMTQPRYRPYNLPPRWSVGMDEDGDLVVT